MVCAGLGTRLLSVRVLQGALLVATKEPFLKSCGSVQLTCPTVLGEPTATGTGTAWIQETCQLQKPLDTQHHIPFRICVCQHPGVPLLSQ